MYCRDVINEFLMEFVDGQLPEAQRVRFEAHLALCRSCREYLDSYRTTIELARAAGDSGAPLPEPPKDLIKAILESAPVKRP